LADCKERDDHGRRLWTAEEVERLMAAFGGGEDVRGDRGGID
jgi:hypothetical protein